MAERDTCMTPEKSKMHIGKTKKKDENIDPKIITHQLTIISKDIISNDIKKYLNDNISHEIYAYFEETYAKKLSEIIQSRGNFIQILDNWKDQNDNKFSSILQGVCGHLVSREESKKFLLDTVVPYIMCMESNVQSRDLMIIVAFIILKTVHITDLTPTEYEQFLQAVNNKYFSSIGQFRDQSYHNWYKLWIFLVRFFAKKIHSSMDLTNKLLRIVEFAFRNSDYTQRIRGYECWKELIDNASLDMKYIISPKQIKLLMTPLKAKFSKQEIVICKRFDVFTYLLEKLGERLVLCLPEYLELCFGPLGDNKDNSKSGQCKNIPLLCEKSTKVLMELIGHKHGKGDCLQTDDIIKLNQPAISHENFETYYKLIIQSIAESCVLLRAVHLGPQKDQAISCMWTSLFSLVIPASEPNKVLYYKFLSGILENFIKEVNLNTYYDDLLVNITSTLLSFDKDFICEAVQYFLAHILQVLMLTNLPVLEVEKLKTVLSHCFTKITFLEEKLSMLKEILNCFTSSNTEINVNIGKIWICAADELISDLDVPMIESFTQFNEFLIWPANHLHLLDEQTNKQMLLPWVKLYKKITGDQNSKKLAILKKLETVFKNNPLLSTNVLSILNVMAQFQTKYSKDFMLGLLEVTYSILQKPNLVENEEYKACSIILQYLDSSLECYNTEKCPEIIELFCNSIQSILCVHKEYKLLESFPAFLKSIPEGIRTIFSEKLLQIIKGLYNDVTEDQSTAKKYLAKELQKVLGALECDPQIDDKKIFIAPTGRSARITQLAKKSPKSPKKQINSPITLRLFGKDPETLSPLKVKGSQLNKSPNSKKKKAVNVIEVKSKVPTSILEENSSDFVAINSEVKFDPDKLSEHQKEMLKRRRDDIPALYEDLSQSLSNSQDLFSAKFNTNSTDIQKVELLNEEIPLVKKDEEKKEDVENKSEYSGEVGLATYKSEDLFSSSGNCDNENALDIEIKGDKSFVSSNDELESSKADDIENYKSGEIFKSPYSSSSDESKKITTEEKRKKKILTELKKLKMDVVGADNFVSVPRRTRPKERKKNEEKEKKARGRKSMLLNSEKTSAKEDYNRRKSVGVVEELISKSGVEMKDSVSKVDEETEQIPVGTSGKTEAITATPKSKKTKETLEVKIANDKSEPLTESAQFANKDISDQTKHLILDKEDSVKSNSTDKEGDIIQSKLTKETPKSKTKKSSNILFDSPAVKTVNKINDVIKEEKTPQLKTRFKSSSRKSVTCETKELETSDAKSPIKSDKTNISIDKTPKSARKLSFNTVSSAKVVVDKKNSTEELVENDKDSESGIKPKKGNKRKNKPIMESEDIIESSQESFADVTSMLNSSKKRKLSISVDSVLNNSTPKTTNTSKVNIRSIHIIKPKNIFEEDVNIEGRDENVEKTPTEIIENEIAVDPVNTTQDTTLSRETSLDTTQTQDSLPDISLSSSKICKIESADKQNTQDTLTQITQETPSQVGLDLLSEVNNPTVLYLDLPKKPQLTESEQMVSRMDTMSICANLEEFKSDGTSDHQSLEEVEYGARSPTKDDSADNLSVSGTPNSNSIPSSPVTDNTPSKQTEFLNSTFDISPITSNSYNSDENSSEIPVLKPIVFESKKFTELLQANKKNNDLKEYVEKDSSFYEEMHKEGFKRIYNENEEVIKTNAEESVSRNNDVVDNKCIEKVVGNDVEDNDKTTSEICCETDSTVESRNTVVEAQKLPETLESLSSGSETLSPGITGIIPDSAEHDEYIEIDDNGDVDQMSECLLPKSREPSNIQERSSRLLQMISRNSPVPNSHRFIKRRCNSNSSPSTGRIKRLMYSLQAKPVVEKLEEVNEDDILTFSREIPSPLAVPRNSILKRKFSETNDSDCISPVPKRKRVNFSDPCLTSKKVFIKEEYHQPSIEARRLFDPNLDNTGEENLQDIFHDLLDSMVNSETENVETEPPMEIVNAHLLKKDKPIYPKLIDCKDDVLLILKKITSPLFIQTLTNRLRSKRVKTIGDLALLSETEINRLPFKVPVVANVYRTLDNYYKKKYAKDEVNDEQQVNNGVAEDEKEVRVLNDVSKDPVVRKLDFKGQIEDVLKKWKNENDKLEDLTRIMFSSLEDGAKLNVLKQCNIPLKDVLSSCDEKSVIENTIETIGVSKILGHLDSETTASTPEIQQFCSSKITLRDIVKNHNIDDLRQALNELVETNELDKNDVIQNCLVPLIETPNNIEPYLNSISLAELGDIVIKRLSSDGSDDCLTKLSEVCVNGVKDSLAVQLCKRNLLSPKDFITLFSSCLSDKSDEHQTEIMIEMFKFISDKLSVDKLAGLHVEFLHKISSNFSNKDK